MKCAGSIQQIGDSPSSGSEAARVGTGAHAAGEMLLTGKKLKTGNTFQFEYDGKKEKLNFEPGMEEHVRFYVDHVKAIQKEWKAELHVEMKVSLEAIGIADAWGTADAVLVGRNRIAVVDFKYGMTPVVAEDNSQLMFYAAGVILELSKIGKFKADKLKDVEIVLQIVQPRCGEVEAVQSVVTTAEEIMRWANEELWEAAMATDATNPPLTAGEHCRWCPAIARCPAAGRLAGELARSDFEEMPQVTGDLQVLAKVLRLAPMIEAWLKACEAEAFELMRRGERIDGFKLVAKKSNREWPDLTEPEILKLLKKNGLKAKNVIDECFTNPKLLSPAQMEKLPGGKEAVNAIAVKPDNGLTVAAESDRREAVTPAISDFEDII